MTLEQCQKECVEHREMIREANSIHYGNPFALGAMAVYRFVLRNLTADEYLAVLSDENRDLLKIASIDRKLVAVVAD